ncbi:MAG: ribbon-helix-helix protein, CopG family [Myxococcota bacterium]|nr:ribbon-helix-helix protein, CopG family [Myxococcota bacterium]
MTGQISIRLPESTIDQLNRIAKETGQKRAEVMRHLIHVGIGEVTKKQDPLMQRMDDFKSEIIELIQSIPQQLKDEKLSTVLDATPSTLTADDEAPQVLSATDVSDQYATVIEAPTDERTTSALPDDRQESPSKKRHVKAKAKPADDAIGGRLNRARLSLGLSITEVGEALNIDETITREILENGRRVPASRAIRVEAKLQQWESRLTAQES